MIYLIVSSRLITPITVDVIFGDIYIYYLIILIHITPYVNPILLIRSNESLLQYPPRPSSNDLHSSRPSTASCRCVRPAPWIAAWRWSVRRRTTTRGRPRCRSQELVDFTILVDFTSQKWGDWSMKPWQHGDIAWYHDDYLDRSG